MKFGRLLPESAPGIVLIVGEKTTERDLATDWMLTHELFHIWQGQHRRWHVLWTWATTRYASNPYELEARRVVAETRLPTG